MKKLLLLLLCLAPVRAAGHADVTIDNFSFAPKEITVKVGTDVTWTNHDDMPHTVTCPLPSPQRGETVLQDQQKFSSPVLDTDKSFNYRFTRPGRYTYHCSIHPHMVGTVVVTP